MTNPDASGKSKESLFKLVGDVPTLVSNLVKAELEQVKQKLAHMGKYAGIGAGLMAGAAVFLFFAIGILIAVLILVIAIWLPAWAAALIVFGLFILVALILVLMGVRFFKKVNEDPGPIDGVKKDIRAVKGTGEYDRY
ncbi:hypothetical protein GCM10027416_02870 [Okibacterium endophyticum]